MPVRKSPQGGDMDHEDLVAEIPQVEKMATAERLKHAKKRRQHQLKKYTQYEKQLDKEQNKKSKNKNMANKRLKKASHNRRVNFVSNVMLLEAAARNDVSEVKELLKRKVSPDVTNEDGLTALHQCCIDDLEEMLKLLLEFGANVNAKDSELWTPLHAAATCGHIHLCKILIDNGAELLAVNADGNMPYDICEDDVTLDFIEGEMAKRGVTQEQIDTTRLSSENHMLQDLQNLANDGGDLEFRGRVGETPLHIAAANGYVQVTEFLVKKGASVDVEDEDSWQPIHAAACWGHLPVLEILVQHGADLEAKTRNGESPFDICEDLEMKERMMELKNEIETKGIVKNRNLVRRRSTNTRSSVVSNSSGSLYNSNTSLVEKNQISASVRRTSMREKSAISWKEAMEEGRRFRESVSSNDEDEDEDAQPSTGGDSPRTVDDVKLKFENPPANQKKTTRVEEIKKDSPRGEKGPSKQDKPAPGSRIKESGNIFVAADGTLPHQPKSDRQPAPQQISVKKGAPAPPASTSKDTKQAQAKPQSSPQNKPTPAPQSKPASAPQNKATSSPQNKQSAVPQNKQTAAPNRPSNTAQNKAQNMPLATHNRDAKKPPPPQAIVKPTPQRPKEEPKPNAPNVSKPSAAQRSASPASSRKQNEHLDTTKDSTDSGRKTSDSASIDSTPSRDRSHSPHSGTLSDLKKQRALALQEKLHNSLRFKDTDQLNDQVQNHNEAYAPAEDTRKNVNNAQTRQQNGKAKGNNNYYLPNSDSNAHKYKFTATTVVGDADAQTSCCVVQ